MGVVSTSGSTRLKCLNCQTINHISSVELDFSEVPPNESQPVGRTGHEASLSKVCTQCSSQIGVTYTVWEFPEGNLEEVDAKARNAVFMERCSFRV